MRRFNFQLFYLIVFLIFSCGPGRKFIEERKEPRFVELPDQKVICIVLKGNADETSKLAFPKLFRTFYRIKENKVKFSIPRARWIGDLSKPKEFIGHFALPISDNVNEIPEGSDNDIMITNWDYGLNAEILHIGPYDKEKETIEKLIRFIHSNGYEISGLHEEEYIKGPGLIFNNPEKYLTIIRYKVRRK